SFAAIFERAQNVLFPGGRSRIVHQIAGGDAVVNGPKVSLKRFESCRDFDDRAAVQRREEIECVAHLFGLDAKAMERLRRSILAGGTVAALKVALQHRG